MKEVKKVSISGIAFTFDTDAYETMNDYIERLNQGYASNPDGKEIVADIEARIAELLLSDNEAEKVVSVQTVNYIIAQMGYPDDLSGSAPTPRPNASPAASTAIPTARRLPACATDWATSWRWTLRG